MSDEHQAGMHGSGKAQRNMNAALIVPDQVFMVPAASGACQTANG